MKAVGYYHPLPISDDQALVELELPTPTLRPHDLLVRVHAVSVNPVDVKQRAAAAPPAGAARVLGFDAAGVVEAVGPQVSLFRPGDAVFYAGAIDRPGSNAELQAVDERIVGPKPVTLSFAQAAALPLTSLTAWELLFDRLRVPHGEATTGDAILIVNGAGGVGSVLTQIARRLTGLTASAQHHAAIVESLAPQGALALIDDPKTFDVVPFKRKSLSVHWELMFTRSLFGTPDIAAQHRILAEVSALVDRGVLRSTLHDEGGALTAENLRRAHAAVESGRSIGKLVLAGV